ncbi:MAG: Rieske (2Fe-2S) protein [Candidatus Eremiobacteraeota bacterium]|nr:Rieske (2Fe-2S) protein [Candidatus Eremiobacteraeota bacterium]
MLNPEISLNRRIVDRIATSRLLEPISNALQPVVQKALAAGGPAVRNALHGTWLGHPLHPVLTDIPVGAWTVTAVLDTLELFGVDRYVDGADAALAIGLAGVAGAAASGYADWSDTANEPKTLGTAHAMLNGGAAIAYVGSLVLRRTGRRRLGIAAAAGGYALMSFAAFLGGELSMGMQIGAKHTAEPLFPDADFKPVLDDDALASGTMKRVDLDGVGVLLFRDGDGIRAIGNACTHRGAPLDEGTIEGTCVRCPWHDSLLSFDDGRPLEGPASFPQPLFETRVVAGKIEVRPAVLR